MATWSTPRRSLLGRSAALPCVFFLMAFLGNREAHAQASPCLYSHGQAAGMWSPHADTSLGASLRKAIAAQNAPSPDAEQLFQQALSEAEKLPDSDPCKGAAFFFAAGFYFQSGNHAKAIRMQQRAVALDQTSLGADSPRLAMDLSELAVLYGPQQPKRASQCYARALTIAKNSPTMTALSRVLLLSQAANFYHMQHNDAEAEKLLRSALGPADALPPNLRSWGNVRGQLARILLDEGREEEANQLLAGAANPTRPPLARQTPAQFEPSEAPADIAQAQLDQRENRPEDAERSYNHAMQYLQPMRQPLAQAQLALVLDSLAEFLERQGRDTAAETALLRAIALQEQLASTQGSRWAKFNLGPLWNLYSDEGRFSDLEPILLQAIATQERVPGPDDLSVAQTLQMLAWTYAAQGMLVEVVTVVRRFVALHEAKFGPNDPRLLNTLGPYADALEKVNEPDEAARVRARARRIRKQTANGKPE